VAQGIDGKRIARETREALAEAVAQRQRDGLRAPGLVTILVGDDPASRVYVGRKQRESKQVGMFSECVELPAAVSEEELLEVVHDCNRRVDLDGVLVQLPLPPHLDEGRVIAALDPAKDVDGLHPVNQGALFTGREGLRPCTPVGCMRLIESTGTTPLGLDAVVVGRSRLVGKPVAMLLLEANATVTVCHSRTVELADHVARADILVAAVGVAKMIKGAWIKPGAVVIDVGMNREENRLVGDVEFEAAFERASYITPVPGGVGPMTVAMLLENTLKSCRLREAASS